MNVTFWNSPPEAFGCIFLGGISISLHGFAMFLCCAIFDYQDEKPSNEKSTFDVLIKDLMFSQFWMLYGLSLIQVRMSNKTRGKSLLELRESNENLSDGLKNSTRMRVEFFNP